MDSIIEGLEQKIQSLGTRLAEVKAAIKSNEKLREHLVNELAGLGTTPEGFGEWRKEKIAEMEEHIEKAKEAEREAVGLLSSIEAAIGGSEGLS